MTRTLDELSEERRKLKAEHGDLFESVSALLFRHDPIGINFEENTDEYESEVGTILPRLKECGSRADLRRVVHEEFVRWFDNVIAGPEERFEKIAEEIWELRTKHFHSLTPS